MERFISEYFLCGKYGDEEKCEDAIYVGDRFVAVIDGVTSQGICGKKTTGRIAAERLLDAFEKLDEDDPFHMLEKLDRALTGKERLRASVIIYDRKNHVVISYGDCRCRIGDTVHSEEKRIDVKLSLKRAEVIKTLLASGEETIDSLRERDRGREAILPEIEKQCIHENKSDDPYGYPVLNGEGINPEMIKIYKVRAGEDVILCSDGYPEVCSTLAESEQALTEILKTDPLMIGQGHRSTKGWMKGQGSFDDRAWVKVKGELFCEKADKC